METTDNKAKALAPITERINEPAFLAKVAAALPRHLTKERFARLAITAINKNPRLRDCNPASVLASIVTAAQLGIEIDGRHGHLVPFRDGDNLLAQFVPDYKGLVQLVYRTGKVASIHLDVIHAGDDFEYNKGHLVAHRPNLFGEDRGALLAVYSLVRFTNGGETCCIMTKAEVEAVRNRRKSERRSPWDTDWVEMAKKTVFKRHAKLLEISSEFRDAEELASREDEEPMDVTPRTDSEKAGFVRPGQASLPASDPFPDILEGEPVEVAATPEPAPAPAPAPRRAAKPQDKAKHPVEAFVTRAGFTLQDASDAMQDENMIPGAVTDWSHIPADVTAKLVASQIGFLGILGKRRAEGGAA